MGFKFDFKSFEKEAYGKLSNAKLDSIKCPKCEKNLGKYSLKELNRLGKLYCKTCKKNVDINMDKVDNNLKY